MPVCEECNKPTKKRRRYARANEPERMVCQKCLEKLQYKEYLGWCNIIMDGEQKERLVEDLTNEDSQ